MRTQFVKSSAERSIGNSAEPEIGASGFYILNRCKADAFTPVTYVFTVSADHLPHVLTTCT